MTSYHNTNSETGETLTNSELKAGSQEEKVMRFMTERTNNGYTADEIHKHFPGWPITSVRRAISNLAKTGKLKKTDIQRMGRYNKMTYVYKIAPKQESYTQLNLLEDDY